MSNASLPDRHWGAVSAHVMVAGHRRLEARSYLTDGYGLRKRIEDRADGWTTFGALASIWQPSRLKGYPVAPGAGLRYLSAGQMFEARPRIRKWIAAPMVSDPASLQVNADMILISRSGEVGKVTAVYSEHMGPIVTDDLLRVIPNDLSEYGWLYAYTKTALFYEIARSSQYGHMIKHLEPDHVRAMPVVLPPAESRHEVGRMAVEALALRRRAHALQDEAAAQYETLVNPDRRALTEQLWQGVPISQLASGRRRFEGQFMNSRARSAERFVIENATHGVTTVGQVTRAVRLGARFKRYFGPNGTPYRSASELFDVNAPVTKRIYAGLLDDPSRYLLEPGDVIMACSGQTYGLLGRTMILTEAHKGIFGSHDLIRITPDENAMRTGYLHTALSHDAIGRQLVIRNASGTSIPHLDPVDVREIPLPRFAAEQENAIADLTEEASRVGAAADSLESDAIATASRLIEQTVDIALIAPATSEQPD